MGKPSIFSFPGFKVLWLGGLISQFGDVLHYIVFLWFVRETTGDPSKVGIVMASGMLPYVFLSLYAGTVVDRLDRKKVLIWSDLASAILLFVFLVLIFLVRKPSVWVVSLIAALLSCALVFHQPAKSAAIPRLVPEERLLEANSVNSATMQVMYLVGNFASALLLQIVFLFSRLVAYGLAFGINALSFVVSALFNMKLPSLVPEREDAPKSPWNEAKEGIRFVVTHPVLLITFVMMLGMQFSVAPFMIVYVETAQKTFRAGPWVIGYLETGFFLGMILGSWLVSKFSIRHAGLAFSIAIFLSGLTIVPMGYIDSLVVFWILNLLCGLFLPFGSIPLNTFIQLETPDAFRGRVNSALNMIAALSMPLSMGLTGFLINWLTLPGVYVLMGIGLCVSALGGLCSSNFRAATLPKESSSESSTNILQQTEESVPLKESSS